MVFVRADPLLVGLDTPSSGLTLTLDAEKTKADYYDDDGMSIIDIKADYHYGKYVSIPPICI